MLAIVGPRQAGKTTLARMVFKDKADASLEKLDTRDFADEDPRGFLRHLPEGAAVDEAQRRPAWVSCLQGIVDAAPRP